MDDYLEQVAVRRKQGLYNVCYYLCWIVVILFGFVALINVSGFIGMNQDGSGIALNWLGLIVAVVFGGIAFLAWRTSFMCRIEYDYTFTNGSLDVSRVMNNRKRKWLTSLDTKDVIRCGPAQGQAFQKTLNEPGIKKHNWFVNREANLYFFFFTKNSVKHLIVLELSDEMIRLIRSKSNYLQRGAWYDADGTQSYGNSVSR